MKILRIITHPYTVIISFFIILINGEAWGGFFLLYLLLGLPYGAIHSVLALIAILILVLNLHKYHRRETVKGCLLEILGVLLLLLSLFLFFYNDTTHYNYGTFYILVPLITLVFLQYLHLLL